MTRIGAVSGIESVGLERGRVMHHAAGSAAALLMRQNPGRYQHADRAIVFDQVLSSPLAGRRPR